MQIDSQYGDIIFLKDLQAPSSVEKLTRVHFSKGGGGAPYDEAFIQRLIMAKPGILPLSQIESAFSNVVPICTELPMRAGFLDNLFITPSGDIALVECKLWRNPEARRSVIAQIIDYASELTTWSYDALDSAIRRATFPNAPSDKSSSLFEMVQHAGEMDEVAFHDAVSINLRRGRFLLLIVGDGIREGVETMIDFLQQRAGLHFTLALVEVALFKLSTGDFIAQPRVLARTTNIERGVVTLSDSRMDLRLPGAADQMVAIRGATITQEHFFEDLEKNCPGLSEKLSHFIDDLGAYHVQPDFGSKTLILRWHLEDATNWNLGTITNAGFVWMDYHAGQARNLNVLDASKEYLEHLAALVPGATVRRTKSGTAWNLGDRDGHALRLETLLADDTRMKGWIDAIDRFQKAIAKSAQA
jgi:hypothetical protein